MGTLLTTAIVHTVDARNRENWPGPAEKLRGRNQP
jgi:hypothetical protein